MSARVLVVEDDPTMAEVLVGLPEPGRLWAELDRRRNRGLTGVAAGSSRTW